MDIRVYVFGVFCAVSVPLAWTLEVSSITPPTSPTTQADINININNSNNRNDLSSNNFSSASDLVPKMDTGCDCEAVEIVSTKDTVLTKHKLLLGRYLKQEELFNDRPSYQHYSGNFYLVYNTHSQGFWAVSEKLNTDVVRLENQGNHECPYRMKSLWRFADGDLNALVYDVSLQVVCLKDPCSVANCGQQAQCQLDGNTTSCICNEGYYGNPYVRCYPIEADGDCNCQRLIFSTQNSVALTKHHNSYGEYFLYGSFGGFPVYQHFAGVEYLYFKDGNWLISDDIGLREAGLQNQGDISKCPYQFRTTWEYADIEQPGWQWVYDYSARLVCPSDACSVIKCGFHATCQVEGEQVGGGIGRGVCKCDEGYDGNPYGRCFPQIFNDKCKCKELVLSSLGASALAQADKMGSYFLYEYFNGFPAYQHKSGLDFLFFAEGNAWVIGAQFGGSRVGIVNFDRNSCPYNLTSFWRHSVSGQLQVDESLTLECNDELTLASLALPSVPEIQQIVGNSPQIIETFGLLDNSQLSTPSSAIPVNETTVITTSPTSTTPDLGKFSPSDELTSQTVIESTIATNTLETTESTPLSQSSSTLRSALESDYDEGDDDSLVQTTIDTARIDLDENENEETTTVPSVVTAEPYSLSSNTSIGTRLFTTISTTTISTTTEKIFDTTCTCKEILINSTNEPTIAKHSTQLGRYELHDVKSGRPVYKHKERNQFLYYHPYSGGNWLINSEVGLLYGGIQNSKDFPICPYLINTVWQYGDSELGGWVYDSSLSVTCPEDPCSVLKCGFRAQCLTQGGVSSCVCRAGFNGDPNDRCYPNEVQPACPCMRLKLSTEGAAKEHQRDKMGDYFLWGYYNDKPVFQHSSGLDFLYFHKNNVWGIGPKIGGNSAGLLNFGKLSCPYNLRTPWEFGTKDKSLRRQVDESIQLECLDFQSPSSIPQVAPPLRTPPAGPDLIQKLHNPLLRGPPTNGYQTPALTYDPYRQHHPPSPVYSSISSRRAQFPLNANFPPLIKPRRPAPIRSIDSCGTRPILPQYSYYSKDSNVSVPYGSFPWHAQIAVMEREDDLQHLCSGVILSKKYVLTAASCLTTQPMMKYRIVVGQNNLGRDDDLHEKIFQIQSI
ncbi:hypothetical protein TCAL_14827 [Tigriopus californicus]|uniref:EGF-like domain-containing protein n=1 Tax=Tigriopus californicus TaxID=6832 RepID=A0A553PR06_TIGCA|nr:uncharacterized protein LOC131882205 [Tigriopus californicus]TRY80119.1 hypothetical protein TCAL_14827 [Tigriopus californicus]